MATTRVRECEQAIGVAALVATTLSALPRTWQLPAGVLLVTATLIATLGVWHHRHHGADGA